MTIKEELASELREAMLARDARRRDVVRQIETEVTRRVTAPGFTGEADDALYEQVIASYVKKMSKARDDYAGFGERGAAMAEKLDFEVEYLSRWLPKTLSEAETVALVRAAIAELGANDPKSAGRVIGHLMKSHRDELDGALVGRLVREELGAG
ncbi:MAG: GatB/YqeY domain-containing protein [Gammaproteobacteria bacterium]|nr:GatB/YqeY domain-containing protein [Gammaproteobacteria bacterium]